MSVIKFQSDTATGIIILPTDPTFFWTHPITGSLAQSDQPPFTALSSASPSDSSLVMMSRITEASSGKSRTSQQPAADAGPTDDSCDQDLRRSILEAKGRRWFTDDLSLHLVVSSRCSSTSAIHHLVMRVFHVTQTDIETDRQADGQTDTRIDRHKEGQIRHTLHFHFLFLSPFQSLPSNPHLFPFTDPFSNSLNPFS